MLQTFFTNNARFQIMDSELLTDMYYAVPELWHLLGAVLAALLGVLVWELFKILQLRQKNYFLNRDRERYAETLYASRDGYFAFIYPDQKVNDPRKHIVERCSRRLAVMMNLPGGTKTSFEDILNNFYKDDAKKITKYVGLLRDEGVSFDDEFALKSSAKYLRLAGTRINGIDGNIYCDMIWFRDVSFETGRIDRLEEEKKQTAERLAQTEDLLNNIPFPVWLRDEKLRLIDCNKKYLEFIEGKNRDEVLNEGIEIASESAGTAKDGFSAPNLALLAQTTNRLKKAAVSVVKNGERLKMEAYENPFHSSGSLDKICTAGALIDVSELDELKRNLKLHQNAQLEILGTLGTAFAVFNQQLKLAFYNQSFARLWQLEEVWLESQPSYSGFLDVIREKRLLPEVPDYLMFKNEEQQEFSKIIEPKEDMLHLPNGKTFRRVRAPHPMGGLIFAFEDISDKLAATSAYNSLLAVQQEILDNLFDAVIIFGSNGRLKFYNQAYVDLWEADPNLLAAEPNLPEIIDSQQKFFTQDDDWPALRKNILNHLLSMTTKTFILNRNEIDDIEVAAQSLSDGGIMVTYKKVNKN